MKQVKIYLIIFATSLSILYNCNSSKNISKKHLNKSELELLNTCLDYVLTNGLEGFNKSYLVNPYFNSFRFNNYTKNNYDFKDHSDKNKPIVFKQLEWNKEIFKIIQKDVNEKYSNIYFDNLNSLSKNNSSNVIINFSGISDKLIFLEIINFCKKTESKQLIKGININKMPKKEVLSLVLILKNGKIDEILVDQTISFELQCDE